MFRKRRKRGVPDAKPRYIGKPGGIIQDRVEKVGPERFGIIAIDCAKVRSKWILCNFYGRVLVEPTHVEHNAGALHATTELAKGAIQEAGLKDCVVAIEMTGVYHRPVQRAFRQAGFETRLVHPFASNHFRAPANPDIKTDDTDLESIFLATVAGFGLAHLPVDPIYTSIQLLARHRRNLVKQRARLQTQIRVCLHRTLPGYADLFDEDMFWTSQLALPVVRFAPTAQAILAAGLQELAKHLRQQKIAYQTRSLERILAWAASAADPDPMTPMLTRIWQELDDHRQAMTRQILQVEREMAGFLVQTPYILLLTVTGINIVSAGELAGEAGPIEHYANSRAITGRAGIFPSRRQSDEVDHADGPLAKNANHRLRAACLRMADNLIKCHAHYRGLAAKLETAKVNSKDRRCRVANRALRMVFQIVSGRQVYKNAHGIDQQYLLAKLLEFHREHQTPIEQVSADMKRATDWLPRQAYATEAAPLAEIAAKRRRGPCRIGELIPEILLRLGVSTEDNVESNTSEARGSR